MNATVKALIKKGIVDTILQIAATTGVRFALVLAIFALSPFVGSNQIATYDLFVVASSILLIFLTIGLDSGLAIVAKMDDASEQFSYLCLAIVVSVGLALTLYFPLKFAVENLGLDTIFDARVFTIAYLYAAANAIMVLLFSFYRWLGRALTASLIIIVANVIGFLAAGILFTIYRTIDSFIEGLLVGSAVGVVTSFFFLATKSDAKILRNRASYSQMLTTLLSVSWPYGVASMALIARRTLDRGLILSAGMSSLLGAYVLVSRSGEVAAFFLALPAMGFAPIIVRDYALENGKKLARILYFGYLILALLVFLAGLAIWQIWGTDMFPANAKDAAPIFLALLVSNLFFGETSVAGFGFVLVQKTFAVALYSLAFMAINATVALGMTSLGYKLEAIAAGFLVASYIYSTLFIFSSERHVRFGYPLLTIALVKGAIAIFVLLVMFTV